MVELVRALEQTVSVRAMRYWIQASLLERIEQGWAAVLALSRLLLDESGL